ncbi:ExeM/NucH family extracellular endonuclease [Corynebacterium macginleyi]|uniref:ExeM/NucH family extracellular endonuclease n=1 Tax=Corynebacterium macginleyi TaxID=38290 RepID=UPI000EF9B4E9|nr:ExeM/NucH family extracellular endonuclease [Corynebacterium macginleyi]RMB68432.1 ExeM/NucH family extracellular endonuclease [Corynebacterium macginleyi]
MALRRPGIVALAAGFSTLSLSIAVPSTMAAPDNSTAVISEVYGGGGNKGASFSHDFIELYNPTDTAIDLTGWSVEYFASTGNSGGKITLSGTIAPHGYYLVQGAAGNGQSQALPTPDAEGKVAMSSTNGSVQLADATGTTIDLVGYGAASTFEGSATGALSNDTSASRNAAGADTDNNLADFTVGTPSPTNSGNESPAMQPGGSGDSENLPAPAGITPIVEIQGTGDASPLEGQNVATQGVVTGVWSEGGLNGFTIQTGGTGHEVTNASPALFVHMGTKGADKYPRIGDSVEVTGQVSEYFGATQITASALKQLDTALEAVTPLAVDELPRGDAAREPFEHMLIQPGAYTVTNNYSLNQYGEVGLAPGKEAFRQPSDVHPPSTDPNSDLQKLAKENAERLVTLDDGRTRDYLKTDKDTPLPYIAQDSGKTIKSLRTTDTVEFQHPVIVGYSHKQWRFQPTEPVTGETAGTDLPISWQESRGAELRAVDDVKGEYTIGAFNVLNYFTSLGEEFGGSAYTDREGNKVTVNRGKTRGAYTESALKDQERKIVAAINALDANVIGLSEIEDGYAVTGDFDQRDKALKRLTEKLNEAAGAEKWAYVPSPSKEQVPAHPDVIRTAFIYHKDVVKPVGESRIFQDPRFSGTAREPLAQEFQPLNSTDGSFVAVANHFKSKGSVAKGDGDAGDGQGNNPNVRNAQAQAVLDALHKQDDWQEKPLFALGDFNAYTHETALDVFRNDGFTVPAEKYGADTSYQFGGLLGSLDHVLANEVASGLVDDAQVWNINADEPVAFEYSRRNYNIVDFYDDSPFRASDHDPVKVGFTLGTDESTNAPSHSDEGDNDTTDGPGFGFSSSSLGTGAIIGFAILAGLLAIPGFMAATGNLQKIIPAGLWDMLPEQAKDFIASLNK